MRKYMNILTLLSVISATRPLLLAEARSSHQPQRLSNTQLSYLTNLSNVTHLNDLLDNICIPRVVGTKGHNKVFDYIISQLSALGFDIAIDKFEERTPTHGTLTFRNIIASLNPDAERYLVLACHYDSKYFKDFDFIAATDSAVPCAMLINLATVMKRELLQSVTRTDLSLKLLFFDGEEAFKDWGPTDSIYGARHLAQHYENQETLLKNGERTNELNKIDVLVLLDLLGTANPSFHSYFPETDGLYKRLNVAERRLAALGSLQKYNKGRPRYFQDRQVQAQIDDDHMPFLIRGVPILHLIPLPFPRCWHKPCDDRSIVDLSTVENLNKILRVFVAEYLHLSVKSS
ncbi:glutaminyl-peptide cyclotransferase isoform X2 [Onthophagus taurus]|uniref:glutaminyl-peptide cyclotransferase isoform X2 n=1 Tax=Onthophagus taurus TaxID=166361 RepID=UPI000C1FE145|nr:glutaminyl-peptide cyclotransferase isoform X2 [Onthophagus taurus]